MRHFHKLVVPLMTYGWCSKRPAQNDSDRVFNKLTLASRTCRMANRQVRKTLYGGGLHLDAIWGTRTFQTGAHLHQRGLLTWHNRPASCIGLLRRWLRSQQWEEVRPWIWQCGQNQLRLDAGHVAHGCHLIRQQWRKQQFLGWLAGTRHEAVEMRTRHSDALVSQHFDEINWKSTRKLAQRQWGTEKRAPRLYHVPGLACSR